MSKNSNFSLLQTKSIQFTKINIEAIESFDESNDNSGRTLTFSLDYDIFPDDGDEYKDIVIYHTELEVYFNKTKEDKYPYSVEIAATSLFSYSIEKTIKPKKLLEEMLFHSAQSIYSSIKEMTATLTNRAPFGELWLPDLNMSIAKTSVNSKSLELIEKILSRRSLLKTP